MRKARNALVMFFTVVMLCVLFSLASCTTDYRTDYERNNGVILTQEQIQMREDYNKSMGAIELEGMKASEERWLFEQAMRRCGNQRIVGCL